MSDETIALVLFDIGFILALVSMVLGPFGITNWAITTAVAACCLALGAMAIAFEGWDTPPEDFKKAEKSQSHEQKAKGDDFSHQ